ncbi:MAG: excinuclease ABC subunit UvrC [Microthrixaceae bacterium]
MVQRPAPGTIPDAPGSYQFKDAEGRVIYVGKAKSLRQRLNNYFADPATLHPRTAQMVATAETVEWIQVRTEVDALMLEYSLLQRFRPRFNVRLVDDKSYPFLALTTSDQWPRAMVMRGARRKGVRYFGPYGHAYAIRETLDLLLRTFPVRTCSDNKFARHERMGRPCLLYHIEKCSGPCIGAVSAEDYQRHVDELIEFLEGDTDAVVERLEESMLDAANGLDFELAARIRDRLAAVRRAIEKREMVAERDEDLDVIGVCEDELEAAVQVFFVRRGRVVGRKGFVLDKVIPITGEELTDRILEELYFAEPPLGMPGQVLVPALPTDVDTYQRWLGEHRGAKVRITVARRGAKARLAETVTNNARQQLERHRLRRASDHNSRARALNELQDHLGLPDAPLRIECFDMSHIQGTDYVGSMVVVTDGLPDKREYRRFKVRTVGGGHVGDSDDFAAMAEVLTRRFTAYLADRSLPVGERGRFQYPPQLLVVDGGKGQLGVAVKVLRELGLDDEIPVCSLAKQFEEVYVPGSSDPVTIPRQSEALFLLQRIRDESHRFAITFHRELRGKRMTRSVLDDVAGLGEVRRKRLLKELGGITAVRAASLEDLLALSWLPDAVAAAIHERTHPDEHAATDHSGRASGSVGRPEGPTARSSVTAP